MSLYWLKIELLVFVKLQSWMYLPII